MKRFTNKFIPSFFSLACLLLLAFRSFGQTETLPTQLPLEKAIEIGLKNYSSIKQNALQTEIAKRQVEVEKWNRIPELFANFDLRRNLIVPTTPVPAIAFNPNASPGEIMPLRFATDWSASSGVNLNYNFFDPTSNGKVKEALQKEKIQQKDEAMNRLRHRYQIEEDYAACLIAQKQLELAIQDTVQHAQIVAIANTKVKEGRMSQIEYHQLLSNQQQAISTFLSTRKVERIACYQFVFDLGFEPSKEDDFQLTDALEDFIQKRVLPDEEENIALQKLSFQEALTTIQLKNMKMGFAPTLSLKGFLGGNYYDNSFRLFNSSYWYGNSYIGLSVTLPITQGLSRMKEIQQLQLQNQLNRLKTQEKQKEIQLEILKAMEEVRFREKDLAIKEEVYQLKEKDFRTATAQFENGKIATPDLIQASFGYQKAKTDYLQAVYDLIIAKVDEEKSKKI